MYIETTRYQKDDEKSNNLQLLFNYFLSLIISLKVKGFSIVIYYYFKQICSRKGPNVYYNI